MAGPKSNATGRKHASKDTAKRKASEAISGSESGSDALGASDSEADVVAINPSAVRAKAKRARKRQKKVEEEQVSEHEYVEIDYIDQIKARFTAKNGLAGDLPPLHDLDEIYQQITLTATMQGLNSFVECLGGRALRVATMCSGTESPILALEMIIARKYATPPVLYPLFNSRCV